MSDEENKRMELHQEAAPEAEVERPDASSTVEQKEVKAEDIEKYKARGISFLRHPTKAPGLNLE